MTKWAHQLGYGGHFSTRSRRYSVILASRRTERRDTRTPWTRQQRGLLDQPGTITSEWHYAGTAQPPPDPYQDQRLKVSVSLARTLCAALRARRGGGDAVADYREQSAQDSA